MLTVLLVLQIIVTLSLIIVILIQRSASDGMAGLAGGGNSLISGRASANLLTRITSILATIFMVNSLVMATIASHSATNKKSIIDDIKIEQKAPSAPLADAPTETKPAATTKPNNNKNNKPVADPESKTPKPIAPIAE